MTYMNDETKQIADVIDMLRAKGVRHFEGLGLTVDLGDLPTKDAAPSKMDEPEVCKCGHPEYAHGVSGCVHGCDLEVCAPPSEMKP